ncbi:MAG: phosphate signaling complex protein PhoU [candidate division KSB1 bacterium]|nr:phosphate signaling complex protein PhoU [candidate division KSB1 bacterium]MDZ7365180.1 phosphate signaling complex protein PhoU [candidate division KSB1 bacterium]MDZ7404390.1 phosphate signaling complex protein PhoU [candidate division KSB1 bacterium]
MASYLEESLQRGIELIRSKVIEMGNRAEHALQGSLQALVERKRQVAYSVILRDQYIDELEKELDRLCLEFLLRQQPVGAHLRFVYAAIKINNELERIGDYAESIARHFLRINALEPQPSYNKFVEIANMSIPMLRNAIQAFVDQNVELARATMELEDKVDHIRNSIHADLMHLREEGRLPLEALAPLLIIASRFERVADQSCNICEEVLFMCSGEYIKHKGGEVFRVLFVDDGNSCVSQMAEGIANALNQPRFVFSSAGISPRPIDARAVRFMMDKDINLSRQTSKYLNQIPNLDHYQVIVALSKAARAAFPPAPTKTVSIEWEVDDPSKLEGPPEQIQAAYDKAFHYLETHIRDLVEAILGDEANNH